MAKIRVLETRDRGSIPRTPIMTNEERVLELLKSGEDNPNKVVNLLARKRLTKKAIRETIRLLINQGKVGVTLDWKIKLLSPKG